MLERARKEKRKGADLSHLVRKGGMSEVCICKEKTGGREKLRPPSLKILDARDSSG